MNLNRWVGTGLPREMIQYAPSGLRIGSWSLKALYKGVAVELRRETKGASRKQSRLEAKDGCWGKRKCFVPVRAGKKFMQ